MIQAKHISKTFWITRRGTGLKEAFKSLWQRKYEAIEALKDISFTIQDGEMVGYIGPNGAGKSSTIKILSGILTPDSGECTINGRIPWQDRKKHVQDIGVVFGQRSQLWWDVPVIDSFSLLKDIYQIPDKFYQNNLDELITLLNLEQIVQTPTRQLSLGQRMRCEIAASLLHNPSILFLDEPTIGLDAVSKIAVRQFIKQMNQRYKTTVILTTHDMQDIEAIADRVILIGKGTILKEGTLAMLKKECAAGKRLTAEYTRSSLKTCLKKEMLNMASPESIDFVSLEEEFSCSEAAILGRVVLDIHTNNISVSKVITALSSMVELRDISIENTSIDHIVAELYEKFNI